MYKLTSRPLHMILPTHISQFSLKIKNSNTLSIFFSFASFLLKTSEAFEWGRIYGYQRQQLKLKGHDHAIPWIMCPNLGPNMFGPSP